MMNPEQSSEIAVLDASLSVVESQERANIDILISTARRFPRDLANVKKKMLSAATIDTETALSCNYRLQRDSTVIEGPSVRMAELAAAAYGNIRAGTRVIGHDGKVVTAQAFAHDLENNVFVAWEIQRKITDKKGRLFSEDMIVTTSNAAAAIAFRNAVLKVIPGTLVKPVAEEARRVALGDAKTLAARRTRAINSLGKLGVSPEQILSVLGKSHTESIDVADVSTLYGIFTAIKEGSTTVEEQFPPLPAKKAQVPKAEEAPAKPSEPPQTKLSTDDNPFLDSSEKNEDLFAQNQLPPRDKILADLRFQLAELNMSEADLLIVLKEAGLAEEEKAINELSDQTLLKLIKQWATLMQR